MLSLRIPQRSISRNLEPSMPVPGNEALPLLIETQASSVEEGEDIDMPNAPPLPIQQQRRDPRHLTAQTDCEDIAMPDVVSIHNEDIVMPDMV